MAKYAELRAHLANQGRAHVLMSFAEIERIIGAPLPPSARKHRPWWSNNPRNSVITHAWLDAGYRTESVDMAGEKLVFRRRSGDPGSPSGSDGNGPSAGGAGSDSLEGLLGGLRGTGYVPEGVDLTKPVWDLDDDQA